MLALCLMLLIAYYAYYYAGIISRGLLCASNLLIYYFILTDAIIQMATLRLKVGSNSWADQFKDCFYVNGKPDWGEAESLDTRSDPSILDYVMHFITFLWKVMT